MGLAIELAAAAVIVGASATRATFADGIGRSPDGLKPQRQGCRHVLAAVPCAAIMRQCGAKLYANHCGDKMLSAM